jgi:hypothetical protein
MGVTSMTIPSVEERPATECPPLWTAGRQVLYRRRHSARATLGR